MDFSIASILMLDGLTNGAIYALVALALVLVFTVTRVIFIPQGEYVAFAALTVASFQAQQVPGTVWLLLALAITAQVVESIQAWRRSERWTRILGHALIRLALPLLICAAGGWFAGMQTPLTLQVALTLALVTPMGPLIYQLAYRPLADASVLALLVVSVGVHFALTGLGLLFFGAEGSRTPSFWSEQFSLGSVSVSGQAVVIFATATSLIVGLFLFFDRSLRGKALRATAVNRTGARLLGISADGAAQLSFLLAAFVGALSGVLIGPTTTVFYDSGFLVGLKGFVAAVFAGLTSFPLALLGALLLGGVEAFGSFWASAYKEVIVFTIILPVLLWRSFTDPHGEEH
jgi:branched-chain amino acid transport system permease protein